MIVDAGWPAWLPTILAAPFVGSFVGVLIRRLPEGRPVALARSNCEACDRVLSARDLVPLASFAALRGRCRNCGAPIPTFHLAVELAAIGVALWAASADPDAPRLWADCVLGWTLLALAWIDWEHLRLPDALTLPLVVAGLVVTQLLDPWDVADRAAGAAVGYLALRLLAAGYRRLRGREGLGQGDAKLLAAGGAWVGLGALPQLVLGGALLGLGLVLAERLRGRRIGLGTAVPFGPCLALAIWIARLYGGA